METPRCPVAYHDEMAPREKPSPEAAWCGQWFDCQHPHCRNSALVPSAEMEAHHEAQRAGEQCPVCGGRLVQDADGVVYCEGNSDHYRSDVPDLAQPLDEKGCR